MMTLVLSGFPGFAPVTAVQGRGVWLGTIGVVWATMAQMAQMAQMARQHGLVPQEKGKSKVGGNVMFYIWAWRVEACHSWEPPGLWEGRLGNLQMPKGLGLLPRPICLGVASLGCYPWL